MTSNLELGLTMELISPNFDNLAILFYQCFTAPPKGDSK